jgi:hypothetical protein
MQQKMSDTKYKPLDPDLIRLLPAPSPPSEQLLKAVDEFYSCSSGKPKHA